MSLFEIIIVISLIFFQSIFGVGLLIFGTPTFLLLDYNFDLDLNDLPSSIKILSFGGESEYNKDLNNLPQSLEKLYLPKKYNKKILNLNPKCEIIEKIE